METAAPVTLGKLVFVASVFHVTELLLWCAHWLILPHAPDRLQCPPPPALCWDQLPSRPDAPSLPGTPFNQLQWLNSFLLKTHIANCLHISPYSEEETNLISMNTFMNIWKKVCPFKICQFQYFSIEFLSWNCILNSHEGNCVLHGRQLRKHVAKHMPKDINPKQGIHLFAKGMHFLLYSHVSEKMILRMCVPLPGWQVGCWCTSEVQRTVRVGLGTVTRLELEEIELCLCLSLRSLVNLISQWILTKTQYFILLTGNSINNTYHTPYHRIVWN